MPPRSQSFFRRVRGDLAILGLLVSLRRLFLQGGSPQIGGGSPTPLPVPERDLHRRKGYPPVSKTLPKPRGPVGSRREDWPSVWRFPETLPRRILTGSAWSRASSARRCSSSAFRWASHPKRAAGDRESAAASRHAGT